MTIEQLKIDIQQLENKIRQTDDITDIIALKKEKIKLETKLIELIEDDVGLSNSEGILTLKEAIELYKAMPKKPVYATGIDAIDRHFCGGFAMSQMIVIAGEKGAGKTLLLMQILKNVSQGFKTMLFSLEMPYWKIVERFLKQSIEEIVSHNLHIADKQFSLEAIEKIIKIEASKGVKFFVIDSIMKIQTIKSFKSINEKYSYISNTISRLAVELDVIIFLVAQMSKEDIKSKNLALKNSGDIEYDADIIFFLQKDKNVQNKRILVCDKNRQTGEEFRETLYVDQQKLKLVSNHIEVVYQSKDVL